MTRIAILAAACALLAPALAAGQVRQAQPDRGALDWTRGLVLAVGAGAADLRAPRPEVARLAAERRARQTAATRLAEAARGLPLAAGGTVGQALDDAGRARLERAIEGAVEVEVDYGSDGSVVLTAGLPIEAVRLALAGLPGPTAVPDDAPTGLIVEVAGLVKEPAVGFVLAIDDTEYAGPVVFHQRLAGAAADPRLGDGAVRGRVAARDGATLRLAAGPELDAQLLARAAAAGAPVAIVIGEKQ